MVAIIKKLAKTLSHALGERDAGHAVTSCTRHLKKLLELDVAHFHKLLPYRYVDTEHNIFVNEHSFGFGLELAVLSGASEELVKSLDKVFRSYVPEHMDLQLLFCGTNKVGAAISQNTQNQSALGGIFAKNAKVAHDYYLKSAQKGFVSKSGVPATLRDYRLFCFVSKRMGYSKKNVRMLSDVREDLTSQLEACGLSLINMDASAFISLVRDMLISPNPQDLSLPKATFDEHTELNAQVVHGTFALDADKGNGKWVDTQVVDSSGKEQRSRLVSLSIEKMPEEFALWMGPDSFCSAFNAAKAITCPFVISVSARIDPQVNSKALASRKFFDLDKKANSAFAKFIPGTVEAAAEWKQVREQLNNDEIKLCRSFVNVLLYSNEENYRKDEANAVGSFGGNGFELANVQYLQLQSYLATLPFMFSEGMFEDLKMLGEKRVKRMTTWNLVNLLPLVSDFKGAQSGVLTPTFRHQLAFLNPHDKSIRVSNSNISVAATSGAGKSFLIQNLIANVLAQKGFVAVIDVGASYEKLCDLMGGNYIDASRLRLNPFRGVTDIERDIGTILPIIALMACPTGELDAWQKSQLREAIKTAFATHQENTTILEVITALQAIKQDTEKDALQVDIERMIGPLNDYLPNTERGKFFAGDSLFSGKTDFVVLELQELAGDGDLMKIVLLSVMSLINRQFYLTERRRPKMCVIDEAWRFFEEADTGVRAFINEGFRTARRFNGSYVAITQGVNDYFMNATTEAIWNNSAYKLIMLQDAKSFAQLITDKPDLFDSYQQKLIKNFREAKTNGFSEFMVQAGAAYSFHRLFVNPFARVLFSTAPEEFQAVKDLTKQGMPLEEAITQVARANYPQDFET